ncbi:complement C1r subcomponent-like [Gastrophryne carolinensis]
MKIEFQSDFSNEENGSVVLYPGFQAYYQAVDHDECAFLNDNSVTWTPPCEHVCHNYIGGYFCSCLPGYTLHSDKKSCKVDCSRELFTDDSGFISSPGYPKPYPADLNCNYSIRLEEGLHISLTFVETFDIDDHPQAFCPYDTMQVFAGGSMLGSYCGRQSPGVLETQSNSVDIVFHTDDSGDSQGWKLYYTANAIKCPTPIANDTFSIIEPVQQEYRMRDYIVVTCQKGYQLIENGKELRTYTSLCRKDGAWHRPMPHCKIVSCGRPKELRNGQHTFQTEPNKVTYLAKITYSCNEPYYEMVTQRNSATFTCSEDRVWKDENGGVDIPICVPVCGKPKKPVSRRSRVIHGVKAELGNFPWQVLVSKAGRGGGFLIGEEWVMTAAHVIQPEGSEPKPDDFSTIQVYAGGIDVDALVEHSYLAVREVYVHPNYTIGTHDHDIALLRLTDTVVMDQNISPICLPKKDEDSMYDTDTMGYVSGFGVTEEHKIANNLRYVVLPIAARDRCQKQLEEKQKELDESSKFKSEKFTKNMFCAGFPEAKKQQQDSCQGDSGGAFVSQKQERWVATGIVSWGIDCGRGYGYYTKISNYIDWINAYLST